MSLLLSYSQLLNSYADSISTSILRMSTNTQCTRYSSELPGPNRFDLQLELVKAFLAHSPTEQFEKIIAKFLKNADFDCMQPSCMVNLTQDVICMYWPQIETDFDIICKEIVEDLAAEEARRKSSSIPPPEMKFGKPDQKNIKKYIREALDDILSERNYHVKK